MNTICKKLRLIHKITVEIGESDEGLRIVMKKSTVLVVVAILSSFTFSAIYTIALKNGLVAVVTIDWIINSLCILFMKTNYHKYYKKCCFCPIICVNTCCYNEKCINHKINMKKVDSNKSKSEGTNTSIDTKTISQSEAD